MNHIEGFCYHDSRSTSARHWPLGDDGIAADRDVVGIAGSVGSGENRAKFRSRVSVWESLFGIVFSLRVGTDDSSPIGIVARSCDASKDPEALPT